MYIDVQNPKTGTKRTVRWYSEQEFAKLYPEEKITATNDKPRWNQKHCLGFDKGYVTIFKDAPIDSEYFSKSVARYCGWWGWYIVSTDEVPDDLPTESARIYWEDVSADGYTVRPQDEIDQLIYKTFYADEEPFVHPAAEIGERIAACGTIVSAEEVDTGFGTKVIYTIGDDHHNFLYEWFTSKHEEFVPGYQFLFTGTIKDKVIKKGLKTTILTNCRKKRG